MYSKYILPKLLDLAMKRKDFEVFRREIISQAKGKVLEIGFGSGRNLPFYKNIEKLYALEPSAELLEIAKKQKADFPTEYIKDSAEKIPFPDQYFDTVVSTWTMCSIPHPEATLKEIKRVLKSGGVFLFIEHGISPNKFIRKIQNILTPLSRCCAGGCHLNRDIENLLENSGLKVERIEKFSKKGMPLAFMYKGSAVL